MYTKLCVHVQFKRKFHIYIVTMFLPSISLVGLSWVSFWIDKKAVPARAGLTITTILAQITLITGTANKYAFVLSFLHSMQRWFFADKKEFQLFYSLFFSIVHKNKAIFCNC